MSEADVSEAASKRVRERWNITASQVTALAAILTSFLALGVSIYETRIMRAWQQASTQPIVEIRLDADFGDNPASMNFRLINTGQGTAYVEGIRASIDEQPVSGLGELLRAWNASPITALVDTNEQTYVGYLEAGGQRIPARTTITFKDANLTDAQSHFNYTNEMADRSEIQVCYCSVFDQCWINDYQTRERAKPVSACPAGFS